MINRLIPLGIIAALVLMLLSSMVYFVDQRQFAVRFALGEIKEVVNKPGIHWKWPAPFQNVEYHDKRILTIDSEQTDRIVTAEKLNLLLNYYVKWRITEPRRYIRAVGGREDNARQRILLSLRNALQNEVSKLKVADVISLRRGALMESVRSEVDSVSQRDIGVTIIDVRLKRVDFEQDVQERVFARMQSERKRVANERRAEGAADSEKIRADADRQRRVILAEAYRDAQTTKGEGDALAASAYSEAYTRDAEFAEFYRSLQAYRSSFRDRSDVMVLDPSSDFFKYFRDGKGKPVPK